MKLLIRDVCLFDNVKLFLHSIKRNNAKIVNMQQMNVSLSIVSDEGLTNQYQINTLFYELKANCFVFKNDGIWAKDERGAYPWISWIEIIKLQPCHVLAHSKGVMLVSIIPPKVNSAENLK